jgi:predicted ATPase
VERFLSPIASVVPHRIVVTGGPCGGKSTVLDRLREACSTTIRVMPEFASMLLEQGAASHIEREDDASETWSEYVNRTILPAQTAVEDAHLCVARENGNSAVIFDRGLLDPAAYLPGGKDDLADRHELDLRKRYTMIVHLESVACVSKAKYDRLRARARYDAADRAKERDYALREAYCEHPNWQFVSAEGGMDAVTQRVLRLVGPLTDGAVERKWRLPALTASFLQTIVSAPSESIEQHCLHTASDSELRVQSIRGGECEIASKSDDGRTRWARPIPRSVFEMLVGRTDHPMTLKTRYSVRDGATALEIDIYSRPDNLITIECLFPSVAAAAAYQLPSWAKGAVEITEDALAALAADGAPR